MLLVQQIKKQTENEIHMKISTILFTLLMTATFTVNAHGDKDKTKGVFTGVDTAAGKVVLDFHQALRSGDKKLARALLADDVTIYEGGRVERSAEEYAKHNMGVLCINADIFA